jgi:hypothetical protein
MIVLLLLPNDLRQRQWAGLAPIIAPLLKTHSMLSAAEPLSDGAVVGQLNHTISDSCQCDGTQLPL